MSRDKSIIYIDGAIKFAIKRKVIMVMNVVWSTLRYLNDPDDSATQCDGRSVFKEKKKKSVLGAVEDPKNTFIRTLK